MGALPFLARQLITVGGFAVAMAAPIVAVVAAAPAGPPANLAQCNSGEEADPFTLSCVPFVTPNTSVTAATAGDAGSCPAGVTGTECEPTQGDGLEEAANSRAGEAEEAAAGTEQIGEDVAEAEGGLGVP